MAAPGASMVVKVALARDVQANAPIMRIAPTKLRYLIRGTLSVFSARSAKFVFGNSLRFRISDIVFETEGHTVDTLL